MQVGHYEDTQWQRRSATSHDAQLCNLRIELRMQQVAWCVLDYITESAAVVLRVNGVQQQGLDLLAQITSAPIPPC